MEWNAFVSRAIGRKCNLSRHYRAFRLEDLIELPSRRAKSLWRGGVGRRR
jgi:hypothetical protein